MGVWYRVKGATPYKHLSGDVAFAPSSSLVDSGLLLAASIGDPAQNMVCLRGESNPHWTALTSPTAWA